MRKLFLVLFFILICNISKAQIIVLNSCWAPDVPDEIKLTAKRDVVIDLQNRTITIQGMGTEGKPIFSQSDGFEMKTSPGFIKAERYLTTKYNEETWTRDTSYVFDLTTGKYIYSDILNNNNIGDRIAQCDGLNGKKIGSLTNTDEPKDNNNSKSKSLLKKLLKKQ